jgi:hypothetical protein
VRIIDGRALDSTHGPDDAPGTTIEAGLAAMGRGRHQVSDKDSAVRA